MNQKEIANLLFPESVAAVADFAHRYPERNLPAEAEVTRFAPSPTGFLHIGGLFTALISERVAHASGGKFFLRIEDTDKKREVENGVADLITALTRFGVVIDEGDVQGGDYGPYTQSERRDIYIAHVKHLVERGLAYPCFCTAEELEETRKKQEELKVKPGYYGQWAIHRNITLEEVQRNLNEGKSFVVRMRADLETKGEGYKFDDGVKGNVSVTENDQDVVLIKSDGLPTYHLAHVVDDHYMGTTLVIRGDEWLSSLSIHLQLFRMFGWTAPKYAHVSPILKSENGNKRKLSKRKDPEAAVEYYLTEGYPNQAVIEYLLNIANSSFEDWRKANPNLPNEDFKIQLTKLSKSGALFDLLKLSNISKEVISKMTADEVYSLALAWAQVYDQEFANRMVNEADYFMKILSIERGGEKPRKDFGKWSDVKASVGYFFDDLFATQAKENVAEGEAEMNIRNEYARWCEGKSLPATREEWFEDLKNFSASINYAPSMTDYKAAPEQYKGTVSEVAMTLRVTLTGLKQTPDLYEIIKVLGSERVLKRLVTK